MATGVGCRAARATHIDAPVYFITQLVPESQLEVDYVASEENDPDMLTKPLGPVSFEGLVNCLGIGGVSEDEC